MRRPQTRPSILPGLAAVGWRHYDKLPTYSRRHQALIRASPGGRSGVAPAIRGLCTGRTSDTQESLGGKIAPLHLHPACSRPSSTLLPAWSHPARQCLAAGVPRCGRKHRCTALALLTAFSGSAPPHDSRRPARNKRIGQYCQGPVSSSRCDRCPLPWALGPALSFVSSSLMANGDRIRLTRLGADPPIQRSWL